MRPIPYLATRLYLVLAVLAGVPAGVSRVVLCVAPDGHVAIEVGEGRCADYSPSAYGAIEEAGVRTVPDGCGDCVDVPVGKLVLSSAHRGPSKSGPQSLALSPMAVGGLDAELSLASIRSPASRGTRTRPAFQPSRTTILRN